MPLTFRAILPRQGGPTLNLQRVEAALRGYAVELAREMRIYPPPIPLKRQPSRLRSARAYAGSRYRKSKGSLYYRRTGYLGKNWGWEHLRRGVYLISNAARYAGYVQGYTRGAKGRRQTATMARRGWRSVSDVSRDVWRRHRAEVRAALRPQPRQGAQTA